MLTNSENPDQTPHNEASDLGLHCFLCPKNGTRSLYGLMVAFFLPVPHPVQTRDVASGIRRNCFSHLFYLCINSLFNSRFRKLITMLVLDMYPEDLINSNSIQTVR